MNVHPIGNRILVKQLTADEVTKSGIIIAPSTERKEKSQYEIVALGNGDEISKLGLKIGDIVVSGKYSGDEIDVEDAGDIKYKILYVGREEDKSDVLATIAK